MISRLQTLFRSSKEVPFAPTIENLSRMAVQNAFPYREPSKLTQKYAEIGDKSKHGSKIKDTSIGQILINLFAKCKRLWRSKLRQQEGDRNCQSLVLPFGSLTPRQFIEDLQFQQLIVDIGHSMLRRVFKGKSSGQILIMFSLSGYGESGELPIDEGAVAIPQEGDGGGKVLNFELVGVVLFDGEVCEFDGEGRFVGVADGVAAVAELEDYQKEQHMRLHSNRGYQIINGDYCAMALRNQLGRTPLYLLQRLFMGSSQFQAYSSFIESNLLAFICFSVSFIIQSNYFFRLFHLILVRSHSSTFCRQPSSSFWQLMISSSSYFSLDSCYSSSRCKDSFCAFNFLPSSTILSTPSPMVSICFYRFCASSFSATADSSCALRAQSSSCCLVRVDCMRNNKNSDLSAEFFLSI